MAFVHLNRAYFGVELLQSARVSSQVNMRGTAPSPDLTRDRRAAWAIALIIPGVGRALLFLSGGNGQNLQSKKGGVRVALNLAPPQEGPRGGAFVSLVPSAPSPKKQA